ncbi:MAG: hypothetical protein HW407_1565 [Bacteroidetes bacterium]|nr:hypothetical protein [Bacteroidota bacterium]
MYCIHLGGQQGQSNPIVCIEGRLDCASSLELELTNILQKLQDSPGFCTDLGMFIDLEKVESICAECFKVFQRIQNHYPIQFRGYSLFLEMELIDHHLLPRTYSKAGKDIR